ncbi:hypothetical protein I3843_05G090700 [Carya illinoinensis]|nr:hypothetical protein I3843_05G090700 [Carya illinoinensis]
MNDKPSAALPVHTDHTNLSFSSSYSSQVLSLNSDSSSILSLSVLNLFIILFMNLMICDFCLQKKENITLIGLKIVLTNPALCQSLKIYSLCKQQAMRDSTNWRKPISIIKGWFSPSMRPCTPILISLYGF